MLRSARNFLDGLLGILVQADYHGDIWRGIAATYLPLLFTVLYWLVVGASAFNVADAAFMWLVLFAAFYIWLTRVMISRTSAGETRSWALSQDREEPSSASRLRRLVLYLVSGYFPGRGGQSLGMLPKWASFMGIIFAFVIAAGGTSEGSPPILLSVLGVALFWAMLHTSYALYYAYLYYAGDSPGGLDFPGDEEPDHMDFAYYAFAVGTTFGTSDVAVTSKRMRRTTLVHGVFSFVYGTAVLAIVINALIRGFWA